METIKIKTDFIKLQQILKLANAVSQGSDAKLMILNGDVAVNGKTVLERGKKIRPGDVVEVKNIVAFKVAEE